MTDPSPGRYITDPLLEALDVAHGFGTIGVAEPKGLLRPKQVHGIAVAELGAVGGLSMVEADATVSTRPATPIGVVTADCVPLLLVAGRGAAVAAVHAGWRGLSAGVIGEALRALTRSCDEPVTAAIGPHAGQCCYEVDSPVIEAFAAHPPFRIDAATVPTRPGHFRLDLESLAIDGLRAGGVASERIGKVASMCTICRPVFESFRRDGAHSGRMVHWVTARLTGRSQS